MKVYLIQNSDGLFYTGRRHKFCKNRDFLGSAKIYPSLGIAKNALSNLLYGTEEEGSWTIYEYSIIKNNMYYYKKDGIWEEGND